MRTLPAQMFDSRTTRTRVAQAHSAELHALVPQNVDVIHAQCSTSCRTCHTTLLHDLSHLPQLSSDHLLPHCPVLLQLLRDWIKIPARSTAEWRIHQICILLRYTHIPTPPDDSTRPLDNSTNSTLHNPQRAGALVTSIILDGAPHGWVPVNTHSTPVLPKWEEAVGSSQSTTPT